MLVNSLCEAFKKKGITSQPDYIEEVAFPLSKGKALQALAAQVCLGTVISVQTNKVIDGGEFAITDPVTRRASASYCSSFAEEACLNSIQRNFNLTLSKRCSIAEALRLIGRFFVSKDDKT